MPSLGQCFLEADSQLMVSSWNWDRSLSDSGACAFMVGAVREFSKEKPVLWTPRTQIPFQSARAPQDQLTLTFKTERAEFLSDLPGRSQIVLCGVQGVCKRKGGFCVLGGGWGWDAVPPFSWGPGAFEGLWGGLGGWGSPGGFAASERSGLRSWLCSAAAQPWAQWTPFVLYG